MDKKFRCMVLMPKGYLPQLINIAMLPHIAAKLGYNEALKHHIPCDYKMNFHDSTTMFSSEMDS